MVNKLAALSETSATLQSQLESVNNRLKTTEQELKDEIAQHYDLVFRQVASPTVRLDRHQANFVHAFSVL